MLGGDLALCLVGYPYRAVRRRAQADDVRERGIAVAAVAPRAADADVLALFLRLGAHRGQLVLRQIAAIGFALGQQSGRDLGMARRARELEYRLAVRSEEHTSELQSLMRISYAVFCLKKKKKKNNSQNDNQN